ncbi:MAG: 1-acyl-sn-glycerol-3-phosphate acyltransferase [Treponema sp.]|jgi:1-acyl-sn-glycerol-3-phosphate acyltransferase|nr:1-acyl-sn-glycerol-3-phosphate acyltransferase [Treponema sp.]
MPYKRGRPVIDLSVFFRTASALGYFMIIPIAFLINYMQYFTRYKNRFRLNGIKKAVTVSNHTTFLDPVKVSVLPLPSLIFQTLLEATVEFPYLGTYVRILGGVPIPRGISGYKKILEISDRAFKYRRFLHFYPEGECFIYNQKIKPFKPGAFIIAAELDIPVIPLVTVFSPGIFKPWSFLGRSAPLETLVVMEPEHPSNYVKRNETGEICTESIRSFAEAIRQKMQAEIDKRGGTMAFYKGQMNRIKGLND